MRVFLSPILIVAVLLKRANASCGCGQTKYAPMPTTATGPIISDVTGYHIESFGQGAYMVMEGTYQALFLVSSESVIVVDAPPTIGKLLLQAIESVTSLPISHLIYSHAHADHIGPAYLVANARNVTVIAHELTGRELAKVGGDPHRPAPTVRFETSYHLQVCNQSLELAYRGPNQKPGNTFIYAPRQKILMLVDIVFPGWVPFHRLGEAQDVPDFIKAHDQILDYEFDHYIGGHLDRAGTRRDVLVQQEYVKDLFANCKHVIVLSAQPPSASNPISARSILLGVEKANPGNSWAYFNTYFDTVTTYCANLTNEKWLGRLGGADVYGFDNADTMINSVRIDYGILGPFAVQ